MNYNFLKQIWHKRMSIRIKSKTHQYGSVIREHTNILVHDSNASFHYQEKYRGLECSFVSNNLVMGLSCL